MKRVAVLLFACSVVYSQPIYDLLLKNGRVMDPANHRDGHFDVAVVGKNIVRVGADLPVSQARLVVDVSGYMVTPGLIDIDAHLGSSLKPDYNTLPYGVTTVADACEPNSKKEGIQHTKVRVLSLEGAECPPRSAGEAGLRFRIAQDAVAQKHLPDTISSGMDWNSILIPRANMSTAMSIFLNLGMTAEQIIERVTSNAARAIKRPQLGTLSEGSAADIAVLEIQEGKFGFLDSARTRLDATRRFRCLLTVRDGAIVWDSEGLSIPDTMRAGPYTNFK
jgi:predicted amidohydrolase